MLNKISDSDSDSDSLLKRKFLNGFCSCNNATIFRLFLNVPSDWCI